VIVTILFTIIHVLVCLFLILVVLAQQGKGQDLASAFGGAGSQTAFGARGTATLLSKITAGAAAVFMITSLTLSFLRPGAAERTVVPDLPAPASESSETTTTPSEEPAETTAPPTEEPPATEAPSTEGEAAPATTTAPESPSPPPQD
jgi:preprotein translocase subunit SecG